MSFSCRCPAESCPEKAAGLCWPICYGGAVSFPLCLNPCIPPSTEQHGQYCFVVGWSVGGFELDGNVMSLEDSPEFFRNSRMLDS